MRTSSTFSILFWIYAARAKNNRTDIYVRITVNGKRVNISLKKKIDVDSWDVKSQKVKGNGKTAREINHYLNEISSTLFQCYRDLKLENRVLSPKLIKARFLGEDKIIHSLQDIIGIIHKSCGILGLSKNCSKSKEEKIYIPYAPKLCSKRFYFCVKGFC